MHFNTPLSFQPISEDIILLPVMHRIIMTNTMLLETPKGLLVSALGLQQNMLQWSCSFWSVRFPIIVSLRKYDGHYREIDTFPFTVTRWQISKPSCTACVKFIILFYICLYYFILHLNTILPPKLHNSDWWKLHARVFKNKD